jgi:hypothetical protein
MCALCAVLGKSTHWTDMTGRAEFESAGNKVTRRYERARRAALIKPMLDHLNLELHDWSGSSWLVSDQAGKNEEVYQLTEIWASAERLAGHACDPLDPDLIESLAKGSK